VSADDFPRIRLAQVGSGASLVVRGGELDPVLSKADAVRFHRRYPRWGRYGVSAYLGADDEEVDVICETRLERFAVAAVFDLSVLEAAAIEVVPTFRRPHITLAHGSLEVLVNGLLSCEPRILVNRHHQGPGAFRP
jgi:hypothetical protein